MASKNSIKIGASLPLTGTLKTLGEERYSGMKIAIDNINKQGGIDGKKIEFIVKDDQYNAQHAVLNTIDLITKDHVDILAGYTGTATVMNIFPLLVQYNQLLFFPYTGYSGFNKAPYNDYLILNRPSIWDEVDKLIDYLVRQGKKNIGIFYQLDSFGMDGVSRVRQLEESLDFTISIEVNFKRGKPFTASFNKEAHLLMQHNSDAVITIAPYEATAGVIKSLRTAGSDILVANLSAANKTDVEKLLKPYPDVFKHNFVFSQVVPSDITSSIYNSYLKQATYNSLFEFEGYLHILRLTTLIKNHKSQNYDTLDHTLTEIKMSKDLTENLQFLFHKEIYLVERRAGKWVYL
ncbi:hypothetical protein DID76_04550 [Candidatus Marinamargulisbacteria bacterium SCGC AG-414-C22]|nr:hypothetical protein DID76_04550 [Candidatus Marinamargulisbacteria bacterium SCGC AG-414-C22]